ncbi:cell division cycle protein 27 homolog B-like isoform X2 [Rhodamnia argentea]|uniref:Cell division cycle protein 27 homolog B-like isoform X2 n=1 Tax=Rhodamnia argentea TaxID=178133 RepID=A0A8B8P1L6_9MYRT|nr:cell division cycle protein 27 homolog B-like isoform X2 [Rhodamnia argentea]
MEAILVECVQNSLRHFMYRNAIFMCERLCAGFPSEVNLQLLAGCYLHNNQAYCAYHILKGTQMPQSRYLFAISCFRMDLLKEAEAALCNANEPGAEVPNGAAGHYLLGLIYRYTDRKRGSIHHFKQALSIDPLLWSAYEELCALGSAEEAAAVFDEAAAICIHKQYLHNGVAPPNALMSCEDQSLNFARCSTDDVSTKQLKQMVGNNTRDLAGSYHGSTASSQVASQALNGGSAHLSLYNTPSPIATQLSGAAPPLPCRNLLPNGPNLSAFGADSAQRSTVNPTIQAPRRKFVDEGKLRKISGRLFSDSGPRRSTRLAGDAGANASTNATSVSGNGTSNSSKYLGSSKLSAVALRAVTVRKGQSWANENSDEGDKRSLDQEGASMPVAGSVLTNTRVLMGTAEVLGLLRLFGEAYRLSCLYRCQDALDVYSRLPHKHYNTGWVLSQVGKAYFELVDYMEADQAFNLARRTTPYSLEGMDIYSTVLYHLKEDMKLSYLAQELIATDRLAPQSWCALGNCYSLQKDHETALKNFQRAVQLDSKFSYAHTLCGHEYVSLEDFEHGIKSYQTALRIDARHYNAWYGLGMVYLRQEKFEFSEHHFRMAFKINPCSSVIMSYLGTALHALKRSEEALMIMEKAILADRKNPVPVYQKANILMSLEKLDKALEVLEELKEYAPQESSVYALMGKIYKSQNMHSQAMLHFGLALDLKPSATDVATIKAAIEKLHVPDEIEESL